MLLVALSTIVFTGVSALPTTDHPTWSPPGPDDVRGPCPYLNTLANHDIIPHSGKNITIPQMELGFKKYTNVGASVASALGTGAIALSPIPGSFDLPDIDKHNALEHDGSLSRLDAFYGDDHSFNQLVYAQTKSYFTGPTIDIATAAKAREARIATANATNPKFSLPSSLLTASFTETPFYLSIFGDPVKGVANTQWVNIFFEQERLPYEEGWTPRSAETNLTTLGVMAQKVMAATPSHPLPPGFSFDNVGRSGVH